MCSGTSAYIHEACFQRYLEYYPDRVCRVCHYYVPDEMRIPSDAFVFVAMSCWLVILLLMSSVAEHYKVMYFLMLIGVLIFTSLTHSFKSSFGLSITIISIVFTFLQPMIAVQVIALFGLVAIIGVMFIYIPPEIMLLFMTILLLGSYSILVISFFALKQDIYLTAFMIPFIALLWACVIRARPPLRR
jgi:hypothetical protein